MTNVHDDQSPIPILGDWARAADIPAPPIGHLTPRNRASQTTLAIVALAGVVGLLVIWPTLRQPPSGTATGSPSSSSPTTFNSAPPGASPTPPEATVVGLSPSASGSFVDSGIALATATAFEAARASGSWPEAWAILSPYSQRQIGTIADFERVEGAYNTAGGSTFEILQPNRNPDFLSAAWLGDPYLDVAANSDLTRAWLVVVQHPDVSAVSAATITLIVAPIGQEWLVWIGH